MATEPSHAFQPILEALPDEAVVVNAEGLIVATNEQWRRFAAENSVLPEKIGEGVNYLDITKLGTETSDDGAPLALRAWDGLNALLKGEITFFELEYPCHSQTQRRWFKLRASALSVHGADHALIVHSSITALKEAEQRFREGLKNLACGIVVIDKSGVIRMLNPAAEKMFGFSQRETIGKNVSMLMPQDIGARHPDFIERYLATGIQNIIGIGRNLEAVRKDGSIFPIHLGLGEVSTSEDTYFIGAITDLSELHKTQLQLREALIHSQSANRAKSNFLAAMSHDLRTPLNSILGFSQLLEGEAFGPVNNEKYTEYHQIIVQSASHLLALVEEILDLSRQEANEFKFQLEPYDPVAHTEEVVKSFIPLLAEKNLDINFSSSDNMPSRLWADRKIATQIQTNLISNSIRHSPEGGTIEVLWNLTDDNYFVFEVKDQGAGFSDGILRDFGEPFIVSNPEHATSPGNGKGYGLGLYICKRYIEARNGRLSLENPEEGGAKATAAWPFDVLTSNAPP